MKQSHVELGAQVLGVGQEDLPVGPGSTALASLGEHRNAFPAGMESAVQSNISFFQARRKNPIKRFSRLI